MGIVRENNSGVLRYKQDLNLSHKMEDIFPLETRFILGLAQKYVNSRARSTAVQETELVSKHSFPDLFLTLSKSLPPSGWQR